MNTENKSCKRALMVVSAKLLADALRLPNDVEIIDAKIDHSTDTVHLIIQGEGLPAECEIPPSKPIVRVDGQYSRVMNGLDNFARFDKFSVL